MAVTSGGLLVAGVVVPVDGLAVANPLDTAWCRLAAGDYRKRKTTWVRAIVIHGTRGGWPQPIIPGAGPGGRDKVVADFWRGDPVHSAAQLVVDTDGTVACLCDLARDAAYHATVANDWSIGIEMAQVGASELYEATLAATVRLVLALCETFEIPFQMPIGPYAGRPLKRLVNGGPDFAGVYGHRDNTSRRGRGDPGDVIYRELEVAGAERFDLDARTDLDAWERRQRKLNAMGTVVEVDGIAGPATMRALRSFGCSSGRELDAVVEMPVAG